MKTLNRNALKQESRAMTVPPIELVQCKSAKGYVICSHCRRLKVNELLIQK